MKSESESRSVVSDSLWPHRLYSPWTPGQNTGVGSLSLLQGVFPIQGWNPGLPHCRRILHQLSYQRGPFSSHLQSFPGSFWERISVSPSNRTQNWVWESAHPPVNELLVRTKLNTLSRKTKIPRLSKHQQCQARNKNDEMWISQAMWPINGGRGIVQGDWPWKDPSVINSRQRVKAPSINIFEY